MDSSYCIFGIYKYFFEFNACAFVNGTVQASDIHYFFTYGYCTKQLPWFKHDKAKSLINDLLYFSS